MRARPDEPSTLSCTRRRDVFISRVAGAWLRGAASTQEELEASLSPLSFSVFSLSLVSFYARPPVALVNIFFALAEKRNNSRCICARGAAARERARTVTYGHARSLTHSLTRARPDTHAVHQGASRAHGARGPNNKTGSDSLVSSSHFPRLISVSENVRSRFLLACERRRPRLDRADGSMTNRAI